MELATKSVKSCLVKSNRTEIVVIKIRAMLCMPASRRSTNMSDLQRSEPGNTRFTATCAKVPGLWHRLSILALCRSQIYTWKDATLKELAELVQDVQPAARTARVRPCVPTLWRRTCPGDIKSLELGCFGKPRRQTVMQAVKLISPGADGTESRFLPASFWRLLLPFSHLSCLLSNLSPQARISFAFIYPDRHGRNVIRQVGSARDPRLETSRSAPRATR